MPSILAHFFGCFNFFDFFALAYASASSVATELRLNVGAQPNDIGTTETIACIA
jgi:hypothetical protein